MADGIEIDIRKLVFPIIGVVCLGIQNLLIIVSSYYERGFDSPSLTSSFIFTLDLIGFSILGLGCVLLVIDHPRLINPLLAAVAFFGWVGFSLVWRLTNNIYENGIRSITPDLIFMAFFFLGAISLVFAFFFFWQSLSEYQGGRDRFGLIVSMIYTGTNFIVAILVLNSSPTRLETLGLTKLMLIPLYGIFNYFFVLYILIGMLKR
ncbi:MAG: hypothetical protein ACFFC7_06965 [Candidatus Hermodarchaeota archaeon]